MQKGFTKRFKDKKTGEIIEVNAIRVYPKKGKPFLLAIKTGDHQDPKAFNKQYEALDD